MRKEKIGNAQASEVRRMLKCRDSGQIFKGAGEVELPYK